MTINQDNLKAWTHKLRDPWLKQANGQLGKRTEDGGESFCCLGVGETLIHKYVEQEDGAFKFDHTTTFPTEEWFKWIGIDVLIEEWDEWPEEPDPIIDHDFGTGPGKNHIGPRITASVLNDVWHLTFPQIADVIDYFGLEDTLDCRTEPYGDDF